MVKCSCYFVPHHFHKEDNQQQIKVAPNLKMDSILQGKLSAVGCIPRRVGEATVPLLWCASAHTEYPGFGGCRGAIHLISCNNNKCRRILQVDVAPPQQRHKRLELLDLHRESLLLKGLNLSCGG